MSVLTILGSLLAGLGVGSSGPRDSRDPRAFTPRRTRRANAGKTNGLHVHEGGTFRGRWA